MSSSYRWLLARLLVGLWRTVPVRGVGRLIKAGLLDRISTDETVISYRSLRARVRLTNPPELALFLWRTYEPDIQAIIDIALEPGMTALDVGANCGVLTLAMRDVVGPSGRVISVDPSPLACQRVTEQAALNGFDNIEVLQAALGSEEGTSDYFLGRIGIGALPSSECSVLEGARRTLREHRPVVVCECYPDGLLRRGKSPRDQGQLLTDVGYELFRPRFSPAARFLARPARVQRFEPIEIGDLAANRTENILALHRDDPLHRSILREVTYDCDRRDCRQFGDSPVAAEVAARGDLSQIFDLASQCA